MSDENNSDMNAITPDINEEPIQLVIAEPPPPPAEPPPPPAEPPPPPAEPPPPPAEPPVLPSDNDEVQLQIPKRIFICHKNINCLSMTHNKWKTLNPNYEIFLFDDSMCEQFLLKEFSELYYNIFKFIPDGPIKSDFWRLCVLYKYGGIYVDADIEPLIPLDAYLIHTSDFVTCITDGCRNFNPHFIAVKKKEHILQLCINEYIGMYRYKMHSYNYWKWSVIYIFNKYLDKLRNSKISTIIFKNKKFQFFLEKTNSHSRRPSLHSFYCIFNNVRLFNTRYINYNPHDHQFTNNICSSSQQDNDNINRSDMKTRVTSGRSMSGRSMSGRSMTGRSMSGRSMSGRSMSSRSMSSRSMSSRSISSRSMSGRSMSSRNMNSIIMISRRIRKNGK
jgi:hypothetical protein